MLQYWKTSEGFYLKSAMWARDTFAVPASSAGPEREFSISGRLISKTRNRLKGKTIGDIMQYKRWCIRRGAPIDDIDEQLGEEDEDSEAEDEFDERNVELEEWLSQWLEAKSLESTVNHMFRVVA